MVEQNQAKKILYLVALILYIKTTIMAIFINVLIIGYVVFLNLLNKNKLFNQSINLKQKTS